MSDSYLPANLVPNPSDGQENPMGHPAPLPGDPRRQAVFSIHGIVYQAWWSIDAWLRLSIADEAIYLEGSEDFDVVRSSGAIAVQVKRNTGTISLGTSKALKALENYWALSYKTPQRLIDFHYLTTSSIATERDSDFGGRSGIEVWRAAQTSREMAQKIVEYLKMKLGEQSPLRAFLDSATAEQVQDRLIRRFHWITDQPELDFVKRSVDDRIAVLLHNQRCSLNQTQNVRRHLESRFWEIILDPVPARRCLTFGELLWQVEAATTAYLPVALDRLPDLIADARPGLGLLRLLREKVPILPDPLLRRDQLVENLEDLVNERKVILITGTVYKGKTTIAQLVSSRLCPDAWWLNLTGRQAYQVDNVLMALSGQIENGASPDLIVLDDLDISPAAYRAYRDSLSLVLHRAHNTGRSIIITAKGASVDSAVSMDFKEIVVFEVPELSSDEIKYLCMEHGCPQEISASWGSLISALTGGHPRLVQVQLAELTNRGWPKPGARDIASPLPSVTSVRQVARQLLRDTVSSPIAEFVYLVSEASLLHRSVLIKLTDSVQCLTNGGDVLDSLSGSWLERIEGDWFRTTALLKGAASEVWSPEKRRWAHICIHDAIHTKSVLSPFEAAALLFHAYFGGEPSRIAQTAMRLQIIDNKEAQTEVERQLLWLPFVALEPGQFLTDDPMAGAILRGLQFRVASTLDSDSLPLICVRWVEEVTRIPNARARALNETMMWLSMGVGENVRIPLRYRLDAIMALPTFPEETLINTSELGMRFFEIGQSIGGLPREGTAAQAILLNASRNFRGLSDLKELLLWLDNVATEEIRQEFDSMLGWPAVQSLGAFVQGAWAAVHEQTNDWEPWLSLLMQIDDYAKRRASPHFGCEAAKARAIILTEYLGRGDEALKIINQAETAFGTSVVLMEQRANVLFQAQNDESVLEIWEKLTSDTAKSNLDPFAYRRAGISAARLCQWDRAGRIFLDGANSIQPGTHKLTRFGLRIDAAMAISLGGNQSAAAKILANAILYLPPEAASEGDERWEFLLRAASEVRRTIEKSLWHPEEAKPRFEPGYASSPQLKVSNTEPGQEARNEITKARILNLLATTSVKPVDFGQENETLANSKYFFARWTAIETRLARSYAAGAGRGFIEALLDFDRTATEFMTYLQNGISLLEPNYRPQSNLPPTPERWFGLLCAGTICAGADLLANLSIWFEDSRRILGEQGILTNHIGLLLRGAAASVNSLKSTIMDTESPKTLRCGAGARLLLESLPAEKTLNIQALLTSALVSDQSAMFQQLFNRHTAFHFANSWRELAQSPFQFNSPRISIPELLRVLDAVENGNATLKNVLLAAGNSLMKPLGGFIERVL